MGAVALAPAPEVKAACLPSNPSSTCNTFDPTSISNVVDRGNFTGVITPPNPYVQVRLQFQITGVWTTPFIINNISLAGDGIVTPISFADKSIGPGTSFDDNQLPFATLPNSLSSVNFANSLISFNIPANAASGGASITARIQYSNVGGSQINSSEGNFTATAIGGTPVPGPLPLLGAGAAFGFSRNMRRRIAKAV